MVLQNNTRRLHRFPGGKLWMWTLAAALWLCPGCSNGTDSPAGDPQGTPAEQPSIEQPAGEQPAGKQPSTEQPAGENPAGEEPEAVLTEDAVLEGQETGVLAYKVLLLGGEAGTMGIWRKGPDGKARVESIGLSASGDAGMEAEGKITLSVGDYQAGGLTAPGDQPDITISAGLETEKSFVYVQGGVFALQEVPGIDGLKEYLDGRNEEGGPYGVRLSGVDLETSLAEVYKALSRKVVLDLRDCTGASAAGVTLKGSPHKKNVLGLVLPESVTTVEANAFMDFEILAGVSMPQVKTLGCGVFSGCGSLARAYLPELVTIEGGEESETKKGAFYKCVLLESVSLPKAQTLGNYAFFGCESLSSVALPQATDLGVSSFKNCKALVSISLPQARRLEKGSFHSCGALKTISLPAVEFIGDQSFYACAGLQSITLGSTPPALEASSIPASNKADIFVPEAALTTYQTTEMEYWDKLQGRLKALP